MKVNVYLSYYNGSRFIKEQIDSVLEQKEVDVHLFIRDDGSVENEAAFLDQFSDSRITIIHGENMGYGRSFMWMVCNISVKADFYAFCDQDDVWLDYKLIRACRKLEAFDEPAVYSALPQYVDANLKLLQGFHSMTDDIHFGTMNIDDALKYQIFGIGCTYVWNDSMNNILKGIDFEGYSFPHDNFMSMVAPFIGSFYRDDLKPLLYRQHGKNIGGNKNRNKSIPQVIRTKYKNFTSGSSYRIRKFIFDQKVFDISPEKYSVLSWSVNYPHDLKAKFSLMKHVLGAESGSDKKTMKNLLMILSNRY